VSIAQERILDAAEVHLRRWWWSRLVGFLTAGLAAPGNATLSISTHPQDKAAAVAREICT
jgi:hypothetical protein